MHVGSPHLDVNIRRISDLLTIHLEGLVEESESEGFRFLRRLLDDWNSGENRFSQPGEALFVADCVGQIVAVGGLNIDPYADDPTVGRVRRFYVSANFRHKKIGKRLIEEIICLARKHFTVLRLYTNSQVASQFYVAVGFVEYNKPPDCTHILQIQETHF